MMPSERSGEGTAPPRGDGGQAPRDGDGGIAFRPVGARAAVAVRLFVIDPLHLRAAMQIIPDVRFVGVQRRSVRDTPLDPLGRPQRCSPTCRILPLPFRFGVNAQCAREPELLRHSA